SLARALHRAPQRRCRRRWVFPAGAGPRGGPPSWRPHPQRPRRHDRIPGGILRAALARPRRRRRPPGGAAGGRRARDHRAVHRSLPADPDPALSSAGPAPIVWKGGARCAVMLSFDLDGETLWIARDPALGERPIHMSMGAYGPKTAMPRILRVLDRYDLKVAFYVPARSDPKVASSVPGWIIEHCPAVVEEILRRGHEVGHHGYLHEKPFLLKSVEEEEALLVKTLEIFERRLGVRPRGSRTPSADPS